LDTRGIRARLADLEARIGERPKYGFHWEVTEPARPGTPGGFDVIIEKVWLAADGKRSRKGVEL
jgi:hypothetical protein